MTSYSQEEKDFYLSIGENIRNIRKSKQIDQEAMAIAVGLSRTSIINIEKGRQRPSIFQLYAMAQVLNTPISNLLPLPAPELLEEKERLKEKFKDLNYSDADKNMLAEFALSTGLTRKNQ
jgi:transcriptional regulator with XRE-family HTH domain